MDDGTTEQYRGHEIEITIGNATGPREYISFYRITETESGETRASQAGAEGPDRAEIAEAARRMAKEHVDALITG